ncbi:MAG: hypothetical protein WB528_25465 [Bradyrhizobium sp.]|jgi:hypothetical protein
MMVVAVKAFSKADEAIALLSFAYPGEILCDSVVAPQHRERGSQQLAHSRHA